ncbi:MAG: HAMP domain-containing histidine kinase, partial [Chloroflexota bacterium]
WQVAESRHRRSMKRMLATTAEDRRQFLRRLDHELKNPLMAIRAGLANFANAPTAASRQSALSTVETQTVRLSRLTSDLRKIAELETRPLERSAVDMEQLLKDVGEVNRENPSAGGRQVRLIVPQAPWPLPAISGDWDLLFLAFHNLLDNAIKFCQPGDAIEVRGREDGASVVVEVADTGPGIDAADLPHVWDELYRGERGRTAPGSGLGLAMVRAIVERHEGSVRLDSKVNQGTVVTVRLPQGAAGKGSGA